MIENLLSSVSKVYLAYGVTDFRKQTVSLCDLVKMKYGKTVYINSAFIFCNKKRNSIKVLCYDKNGFILAQKTLIDAEKMKFQWPKNQDEMCLITKSQLNWLLSGLAIHPKKTFKDIDIESEKIAI